ncbi:MAG TPA: sigma 54-interacting transcriptional regulator [Pseudomonadota bacterium]|nr:sigma 54-interacting transcriptional regulator [Pseudomonadota bacterium]
MRNQSLCVNHETAAALRILLVDPDPQLHKTLHSILAATGDVLAFALSVEEALHSQLRTRCFHLVLCGQQQPGLTAVSLQQALLSLAPQTAFVMVAKRPSVQLAVRSLKLGALDYLTRPLKHERVLALCAQVRGKASLYLSSQLQTVMPEVFTLGGLQSRTPQMVQALQAAWRVLRLRCGVLLSGEAATGKATLARLLHEGSAPAGAPFLVVDPSELSPRELTRQLLGGQVAMTAASADGVLGDADSPPQVTCSLPPSLIERAGSGTLYIREVAGLPMRAQLGLLSLIERGAWTPLRGSFMRTSSARVIVATEHPPDSLLREERLHPELYRALAATTLLLPPLRERISDLSLLVPALLAQLLTVETPGVLAATTSGILPALPTLTPEALRLLGRHTWPGNLAELRRVLQQAWLRSDGVTVQAQDLPLPYQPTPPKVARYELPFASPLSETLQAVVTQLLAFNDGNRSLTAELLGISRRSLYSKLAEAGQPVSVGAESDEEDD